MTEKQREEQKKRGIGRFLSSFKYSLEGLKYAYKHEQSLFVHVLVTILVVGMGIIFHIRLSEWVLSLIIIALVIATELINTSIEALVDLSCPKQDPLAKIAKDTASAAVFVFSFTAAICGVLIYLPKLIDYITFL